MTDIDSWRLDIWRWTGDAWYPDASTVLALGAIIGGFAAFLLAAIVARLLER